MSVRGFFTGLLGARRLVRDCAPESQRLGETSERATALQGTVLLLWLDFKEKFRSGCSSSDMMKRIFRQWFSCFARLPDDQNLSFARVGRWGEMCLIKSFLDSLPAGVGSDMGSRRRENAL